MISEELRAVIAKYDQSHILKYYDEGLFTEEEKKHFETQLSKIDFERLDLIYKASMKQTAASSQDAKLDPMDNITFADKLTQEEKDKYLTITLDAIAKNEVALILMGGGQGTRLGCSGPKGEYDIGLLSHKPLFQLQTERILRMQEMASRRAGKKCAVHCYVMTSPMTHADTLKFYRDHHYFGLEPEQVVFFSQGTLPCMDDNGHIILSSRSEIATAPDGNGGLYMGLYKSAITVNGVEDASRCVLDDMVAKGAKYVQIYGVDNAFVRIPDPLMFGVFIADGDDVGNACVLKNSPTERVGIVCRKAGKYEVVEYSELSDVIANMRDAQGNLVFGAGFICNLWCTVEFLRTKCNPASLPLLYHIAHKAIPYYDDAAKETVKPKQPNGVKMESFIFDVFPFSQKMGCTLVSRTHFTPVKNSNDAKFDCPDTAREIMTTTFVNWLKAAGCELEGEVVSSCVEVSGLVSFDGENLERLSGLKLQLPCFICQKSEASEEELKGATKVSDAVVLV
ncbi:hypothetical protein WA556_006511, partial [Blastocystis sp. ATCC 50177/Nand II]